ncbi:MAG: WG repeat-containing protein [Bacteroidota bacterium]
MKHRTNMTYKHLISLGVFFILSNIAFSQGYPIIQDGKATLITKDGILIDDLKLAPWGVNLEKLISTLARNYNGIPNSEHPKQHFLTLNTNKTSFILKDSNGKILDEYRVSDDTLEIFFYLHNYSPSNPNEIAEVAMIRPSFSLEEVKYLREKGFYNDRPIKLGIKNREGEVLLPPIKIINGLGDSRSLYIRAINDELFFCNEKIYGLNGKVVVEADRQQTFEKKFIKITKDDKYGLIDMEGEIIIPYQEREIKFFSDDKVILSGKGKPDQLINFSGDTLMEAEVIERRSYKVETSVKDSIYGFINSDAEWIVQPKKHVKSKRLNLDITSYDLVKLEVKNYNDYKVVKQGVVNINGQELIAPKENIDITILSDEWVKIIELDNDSLSYLKNVYSDENIPLQRNKTLTISFKCSGKSYILVYEDILFYEEFMRSKEVYKKADIYSVKDKKLQKIDNSFELVDLALSDHQNVIIVKNQNEYFLFDPIEEKTISQGFKNLTFGSVTFPSQTNKLFIAEFDGKKGVINETGEWQVQPEFHRILPFYGELAVAQKDSLSYQYINKSGETVWKLPEDDKTAWNEEHFLESFENCTPLIFNDRIGNRGVTMQYEIKGPSEKKKGCIVKSTYLHNPNPDWVNKSMTCTYDNSLPFKKAYEKSLPNNSGENPCNCEGELWEVMSEKK